MSEKVYIKLNNASFYGLVDASLCQLELEMMPEF